LLKENFKKDYPFVCRYACYVLAKLLSKHLNIPIGGEAPTKIELTSGVVIDKEKMEIREFHRWITLYINCEKTFIIDPTYGQFNPKFIDRFIIINYKDKDKFGYVEWYEETSDGKKINNVEQIIMEMIENTPEERYRRKIELYNFMNNIEGYWAQKAEKVRTGEDLFADILSSCTQELLNEIVKKISESLEEKNSKISYKKFVKYKSSIYSKYKCTKNIARL